jgi:RNA polymerase sigma-70 factor (ECF subfamily)
MTARAQPSLRTRRSLISRIKDWGDRDSWQQFYDTYSGLIFGAALSAGLNREEAEEVLQETVLTVAKKLRAETGHEPAFKYNPEMGSFKGWLLNTTRWKITDQFRKRGALIRRAARRDTRTNRTPTVAQIPDPNNDFEIKFDQDYRLTIQEAALERVKRSVKAKHYQVYDLYVLKQWPASKVASFLGLNAGQVFVAKHRVMALMKKEVQRLQKEVL